MADRPILFSAPMVRALLAGTKTQTRRIISPQPVVHPAGNWSWEGRNGGFVGAAGTHLDEGFPEAARFWMRIQPADRLWVREAWKPIPESKPGGYFVEGSPFYGREAFYRADDNCPLWADGPWKPSIHLARKHSRLTLTVTDVRVQRLQDISEEDARAEGVEPIFDHGVGNQHLHRIAFDQLWERIHGAGATYANPWVAAYTFSVEHRNIDTKAIS